MTNQKLIAQHTNSPTVDCNCTYKQERVITNRNHCITIMSASFNHFWRQVIQRAAQRLPTNAEKQKNKHVSKGVCKWFSASFYSLWVRSVHRPTPVRQFDLSILSQQQVLRLQVAMNHTAL